MKKKQILKFMLVGCLFGTSIHPIIKANEQINSPIVSGIPKKWTNDPIRLTILRNTNDFMYSFSIVGGISSTAFDFDSCSAYYFGVDLKFRSLITSCYDSTKNNLYAYGVV
ncbi:MAG: hypothetical protein UIM26_09130 [Longicatena sp.]|nr:hypothetical protein [Longicatena sp.]